MTKENFLMYPYVNDFYFDTDVAVLAAAGCANKKVK